MNQADKEWIAIMFYTNKTYRKTIIYESKRLQLYEGIADSIKNAWAKAKEKAGSFLEDIKEFAGELIPDTFLIGLGKLGDVGKQIWDFITTIGGKAKDFFNRAITELKNYIESKKDQLVAAILKLVAKVLYKVDMKLYNQVVELCKKSGIDIGLKQVNLPAGQPEQQQQQPQGKLAEGAIPKPEIMDIANPRAALANILETVFEKIEGALTPDLKEQIIQTLFPGDASDPKNIGAALILPLAQTAGTLTLDTLLQFINHVGSAFGALKQGSGGFKLFKETSLVSLLTNNFDALKNAIIGLVRGSSFEAMIRVLGGDLSAGFDIAKQIYSLIAQVVKQKLGKDNKELNPEANPQDAQKAQETIKQLSEIYLKPKKIMLKNIIYDL